MARCPAALEQTGGLVWVDTGSYQAVSVGPVSNGQRSLGRLEERTNDLASELDLAWR